MFDHSSHLYISCIHSTSKKVSMVQANDRELHFSMVDGDFKKFEGKWSLKSGLRYNSHIFGWKTDMFIKESSIYMF